MFPLIAAPVFDTSASTVAATGAACDRQQTSNASGTLGRSVIDCTSSTRSLHRGKSIHLRVPRKTRKARQIEEQHAARIHATHQEHEWAAVRRALSPDNHDMSALPPIQETLALAIVAVIPGLITMLNEIPGPRQQGATLANTSPTHLAYVPASLTSSTADATPLALTGFPAVSGTATDFRKTLTNFGDKINQRLTDIYNKLPTLLPQVAADTEPERHNPAYWQPPYRHPQNEPADRGGVITVKRINHPPPSWPVTATAAKIFNDSQIWSAEDQALTRSGIKAYRRWPAAIAEDDRKKGIVTSNFNGTPLPVNALLDGLEALISYKLGGETSYSVDLYEYNVMISAILSSYAANTNNGVEQVADGANHALEKSHPTKSQSELQTDVAYIFVNAVMRPCSIMSLATMETVIHEKSDADLKGGPMLNALPAISRRLKAELCAVMHTMFPNLTVQQNALLDTLTGWYVNARLSTIEPLFAPRFNLSSDEFSHTKYHSRDGISMRIGAAFLIQFPAAHRVTPSPAQLREAGLHHLIHTPASHWSLATTTAVTNFGHLSLSNATDDEALKAGAEKLIEPEMKRIGLLKAVERCEEEFVFCIKDTSNDPINHERQSRAALKKLALSKSELYVSGLRELAPKDRGKLIEIGKKGALELFATRLTICNTHNNDIAYRAVLNGTSGAVVKAENDYYLFSHARSWGSPTVSCITDAVAQAGGVAEYMRFSHSSLTGGIHFPSIAPSDFATHSVGIFARGIVDIAREVAALQSYPEEIHQSSQPELSSQPPRSIGSEIIHSRVYVLVRTMIGFVPKANCLLPALDLAEMMVEPAKTWSGFAAQATTLATDTFFCFLGFNPSPTLPVVSSIRTAFKFSSQEAFAEEKLAQRLGARSTEIKPTSGLQDYGEKPLISKLLTTRREDLHFRNGFSHLLAAASVDTALPTHIFFDGTYPTALESVHNLLLEGLIQKPEGGAIYLIMGSITSPKKVGYLWNELEKKLTLQTDKWLLDYGHLIDKDPQLLATITHSPSNPSSTASMSKKLYQNKRIDALRPHAYQSHFDHPPEPTGRDIYTVKGVGDFVDRNYIKLKDKYYLLGQTHHAVANMPSALSPESTFIDGRWQQRENPLEKICIIGHQMPKDLRLDMSYIDGGWQISNNHLIGPVSALPKGITSADEAFKEGFNHPDGWSISERYIDYANSDQFILSLRDEDGSTLYRRGPNRNNAFEPLSKEEFETTQYWSRRRLLSNSQTSCSNQANNLRAAPVLTLKEARSAALKKIVETEVQARAFYERPLLRIEMLADNEQITRTFTAYPGLSLHFNSLLDKCSGKTLPQALSELKFLNSVEKKIYGAFRGKRYWGTMMEQLKATPEAFGDDVAAIEEICNLAVGICSHQDRYTLLKENLITKIAKQKLLHANYIKEFIEPEQRLFTRLWGRYFAPLLTSDFCTTDKWVFEIQARGMSGISSTYGKQVAAEFMSIYTNTHQESSQLLKWEADDSASFWMAHAKFYAIDGRSLGPAERKIILSGLSNFKTSSHPDRMSKLRIISPSLSPQGMHYQYNPESHLKGHPQEASLFGNKLTGYTYDQGDNRGKLYLSTATFLSPSTSDGAQTRDVIRHELAHLVIPQSDREIYLIGDGSKYGYYSPGSQLRQAKVILRSPDAFCAYVHSTPGLKEVFLEHFKIVSPISFGKIFPNYEEVGAISITVIEFDKFVHLLFNKLPATEKMKAFAMPDFFITWFEHMGKIIPQKYQDLRPDSATAKKLNLRVKRQIPGSAWTPVLQRIFLREGEINIS